MLVIRLARTGRNKYATYRIVAAEKRYAATGKFVEILGRYNPHTKELVLDKEGIQKRVDNGAQPSNTVLRLMEREGMTLPKWAKIETRNRAPKKEPEVKEETEAAPDAEAEVAAEATETVEAAAPDTKADPDEKAAASNDAQEAAADAAEEATQAEAK